MSSRQSPVWVEHAAVLAAFTIAAFVMSFPLVTQFGDHLPGVDGDVWSYLWALGWARVSVLNLGVNPFHTDYVFYPLGGATQLLWGTALPSFASIPLQLAFGLVPAFNLVYLASSVLTGYGMYLLAKSELRYVFAQANVAQSNRRAQLAALFAGFAFTFAALRLGYGIAFTNLFHTEFIPFYVLMLLRATRAPTWKNAILAGIFFALNVYIDFQIAAFLAVLTAIWFVYAGIRAFARARQAETSQSLSNLITHWLALVVIAGILSLPMLGLILNDFAIEGGDYIRVFPLQYSVERSYDLFSYVVPNARSTFYQNLPTPRIAGVNVSVTTPEESELSPDRQAFLGVTVLLLALLGALRFGRALAFWIVITLFFALLSFGPLLHIAGMETSIPMPYALFYNVPILNHIRIPMRYGLMVVFGVSLLAGAGAYILLSYSKWLIVPLIALLLIETAVFPYPMLAFRVPPIYKQLAQEPGDFTILEIPSFNWRRASRNEAYQAIHQKRILRAYTNRVAPDLADYFNLRQTPIVIRSLRILEGAEEGTLTPGEIDEDRVALDDTLRFFNLRYAILHRDEMNAQRATQIDAYLRDVMQANVVSDDGSTVAYTLPQPNAPSDPLKLDLAQNSSLMYLGRGWQIEPLAKLDGTRGRFMNSGTSEIYLPHASERTLSISAYSPLPNSEIQATMNGQASSTITLNQNWQTYTLPLSLSSPMNILRLVSNPQNPEERIAVNSIELK